MAQKKVTKTSAIDDLIAHLNAAKDASETLARGKADGHWKGGPNAKERDAIVAARQSLVAAVNEQIYQHQMPRGVFDPADPDLFGIVAAIGLVHQDREPLNNIIPTYGSGVYAIYYRGSHPQYRSLAGKETPIYVGKTNTPNSEIIVEQGTALTTRLGEHAKSISAGGLGVDNFEFRRLVIAPGWEPVTESALIDLFRPIWNKRSAETDPTTGQVVKYIHGFGKHGDSSETRGNKRSPWDTLHPGRKWATDLPGAVAPVENQMERREIEVLIDKHFADHPPITTKDEVVKQLIERMQKAPRGGTD
ncbi:hypothetical protein ABH922_001811 [Rhodococcus sp. 27YEA15]|uniref:Eco29kI family restriction endonuclease n=1 Tax=Rhodococcus sp. 27YEA15 TaxID=3156259 RepID=UPI003C7E389D